MPVLGQELFLIQGEDVAIILSPDQGPINITNWSIRWQLRPSDGSPTIAINKDNRLVGGLIVTDPLYGLMQITLFRADTINLALQVGSWFWELRRFDPGASTCLAKGTLVIETSDAQA